MTHAKAQNNRALILRRQHTGDYDILVNAFTAERGKIRAMAKNAGRPGSTRAPHLEPITVSTLQLVPAGDLDFITQALTIDPMTEVKDDLDTLGQAHCITETLEALTEEHDPCPELFNLATATISQLPGTAPGDTVIRFFEYHALRLNGTQPELHHCVECFQPVQPNKHRFSTQLGGVLCHQCNPINEISKPISLRALKVLRLIQTGDLHRLKTIQINPNLATELRHILSACVSHTAGRDIKSNAFLDSIRRKRPQPQERNHTVLTRDVATNGHNAQNPNSAPQEGTEGP